jgi:integrase
MFTDHVGGMLKPNYVTKAFKAQVGLADLPPIRLHDVRHSAASLMLAAGTSMKVVSDTLGHSGIEVTANIYASVYDDDLTSHSQSAGPGFETLTAHYRAYFSCGKLRKT